MIFKHDFDISFDMLGDERFVQYNKERGAKDIGRLITERIPYDISTSIYEADRYTLKVFVTSFQEYLSFSKAMHDFLKVLSLIPATDPVVNEIKKELERFENGE